MNAFRKMTLIQTKLYLRDPMSIFFTLLFGPMLLLIMGLIFGNAPQAVLNGQGQMDLSVPAYIGLAIGMTALTSLPISAAQRREAGVLRRFSATPLSPLTYFFSDVLAPFFVTLLGVVLIIVLGFVIFQVHFSGNWLSLLAGTCLSVASFFALGYTIASLVPNSRTAIVLGNILIIPMSIFSGALVPLEVMPATVTAIAQFVPLRHVVTLMRGLWLGEAWGAHWIEALVLAGMFLVGTLIIAFTFKWE